MDIFFLSLLLAGFVFFASTLPRDIVGNEEEAKLNRGKITKSNDPNMRCAFFPHLIFPHQKLINNFQLNGFHRDGWRFLITEFSTLDQIEVELTPESNESTARFET